MHQRRALVVLLLTVLLDSFEAQAGTLNPGDILVVDQMTVSGSIFRVDPVTGAQTIVSSGRSFQNPRGIALDGAGQILVADAGGLIFRVDPVTGAQTIVSSGGSLVTPQRLVVDGMGRILVADAGSGGIIRVDPIMGAQTTVASGGSFSHPYGIALDAAGRILVADRNAFGGSGGIIRVDPIMGAQTTVASGGSFVGPTGIAVDAVGRLFVADLEGSRIIRVDPMTGIQTIVSSGGSLVLPFGIDLDAAGKILVADTSAFDGPCPIGCGGIIGVDPVTGAQTTVSSGGSFENPSDLVVVPAAGAAPVPEPGTLLLLGVGLAGVTAHGWRKRRQSDALLPSRHPGG